MGLQPGKLFHLTQAVREHDHDVWLEKLKEMGAEHEAILSALDRVEEKLSKDDRGPALRFNAVWGPIALRAEPIRRIPGFRVTEPACRVRQATERLRTRRVRHVWALSNAMPYSRC